MSTPRFGIIGDYNPTNPTHIATDAALNAAGACSIEWLATDESHNYARFDGLICSPASPYKSERGALNGFAYGRKNKVPLLGTCGGFQHLVLEFARNVAGVKDAAHQENDPYASVLFLSRLACSLAGKKMNVAIEKGTLAHRCYGTEHAEESYYCDFGLNSEYRGVLENAGLVVSGCDSEGEVRVVELPGHPFFVGTLFVPQMRTAHPLIAGLYSAAALRSAHAA